MLPSSCSDATIRVEPQPAEPEPERNERIGPGMVCSLVLHGLAALLIILLLPSVLRAPDSEQVMLVGLVELGAGSGALPRQDAGEPVQEATLEAPRAAPADPEPAAPTVEAAPPEPEHVRQPEKPAVVTPRRKPEPSKSREGPKPDPLAAVKPPDRAAPPDDLEARLKSLARQQQLQAQAPVNRNRQNDAGSSSLAAVGSGAAGGGGARYNVKDFIRAQIERHWRLDAGAPGADFVVAIHVMLNRDGSVKSAEIVDDPRYRTSAAYQALARSARNAVLLSSPLDLPPGRYDEVADITLNFNPRNALQ
jgi:outer membrane biosynthesis protein TonB